jgi:polysaccharide deacetylase 2 family uncharacterized protein YibQ
VRTSASLAVPARDISLPEPALDRGTADAAAAPDAAAPDTRASVTPEPVKPEEAAATAESAQETAEDATETGSEAAAGSATPNPVPRPNDRTTAETPTQAAEAAGKAAATPPPAAEATTDADGSAATDSAEARPGEGAAGALEAAPAADDAPAPSAPDSGENARGGTTPAPQAALAPPIGPDEEIELATVDPALSEAGENGPLPVIAGDGRQPWQTYRRPYRRPDGQPVIALMVSGLGLSAGPTQSAIQDLPPQVSLAFMPYAENLPKWAAYARAAGHEVFVNVPMEPFNYPANDPGPKALLTSLSPEENTQRLRWTLSRFTGYVGITNYMGSLFTTEREPMQPVIDELKARGLMFFDSWPSRTSVVPALARQEGLAYASSIGFVDITPSTTAIRGRLEEVEKIARDTGYAAAIGLAFPLTIEVLAAWSRDLESRGFSLVPVSAMVEYER